MTVTPGPWKWRTMGAGRNPLWVLESASGDAIITTTAHEFGPTTDPVANRCLIAAAPQMADYIRLHAERDPEARAILQEAGVLP